MLFMPTAYSQHKDYNLVKCLDARTSLAGSKFHVILLWIAIHCCDLLPLRFSTAQNYAIDLALAPIDKTNRFSGDNFLSPDLAGRANQQPAHQRVLLRPRLVAAAGQLFARLLFDRGDPITSKCLYGAIPL
jgi:hypothetical protein